MFRQSCIYRVSFVVAGETISTFLFYFDSSVTCSSTQPVQYGGELQASGPTVTLCQNQPGTTHPVPVGKQR